MIFEDATCDIIEATTASNCGDALFERRLLQASLQDDVIPVV